MSAQRTENVVGALALVLSDALLREAQSQAPELGPAAAAINLVGSEPGLSIERLRRALGLSHPGAVRLVDRLVADGLMRRAPSDRDRRAVALRLTEAGEAGALAIRQARQRSLAAALQVLTAEEQASLTALAEKLLGSLVSNEDEAYAVCRLCDHDACTDCPVDLALEIVGPASAADRSP